MRRSSKQTAQYRERAAECDLASTAAIAPRSAATLIVLAMNSKNTSDRMTGGGKFRQTLPAMPWPVTRPMRAEIS